MKPLVGVDIGATEVRVVQITGVDHQGFAVIRRIGRAPVRPDAISGGRIKNPHPVSLALATAFKDADVQPRGFVVGLSSPDVAVSQIMLSGAIKASEREGVFRTNQREISPALPLSTSAFSTCLLHSELGADSAVNDTLMAAVCARSELETITQVCKLARAVPRAVDLSGAATLRALVRCAPDSTDVATIIDIGATKTSIATRQGRYLRSLRVVGVGGADFTRAIVSATKDDPEAAEQRKHSMRVDSIRSVQTLPQTSYMDEHTVIASDSVSQTDFEEAAERVCVALLEQIQDAVDQDASTYDSYPQGIILTGGGALLGGLKERISQRLGVQTRIGRPWGRIERNRKTETYFTGGTEDVEVLQTLSTAIGLGLWTESK